jgi:hypothetical protein
MDWGGQAPEVRSKEARDSIKDNVQDAIGLVLIQELTFWQEIRHFVSLADALSRPRQPGR